MFSEVEMKSVTTAFSLLLIAGAAGAADIDNGADLHFEHCTGCHDSGVYTRAERKVHSREQLGRQVRFCRDTIGVTWFDDEVEDVIEYLDKTYYRF
jgi:hypothetical protein